MADTIYPSPGRCIYCSSTKGLTDEHAVPLALNGDRIIQDGSCDECRKLTQKFEDTVLRVMLRPIRIQMGMTTRRKKQHRDARMKIDVIRNSLLFSQDLHPSDAPFVLVLPVFETPRILLGVPPRLDDTVMVGDWVTSNANAWVRARGHQRIRLGGKIYIGAYMRMLAKIAHCYAVAEFGLDNFTPLLVPIIRSQQVNAIDHFVGGFTTILPAVPGVHHELNHSTPIIHGVRYLMVRIRLFAHLGAPIYLIVAGTLSATDARPTPPPDLGLSP
jgi:hypothetical protein